MFPIKDYFTENNLKTQKKKTNHSLGYTNLVNNKNQNKTKIHDRLRTVILEIR